MDGLGAIVTVTTPAAGAGWSVTVPTGYRWRMWGGSCRFVANATVVSRFATITYENGNGVLFSGTNGGGAPQANQTRTVNYYDGEMYLQDVWIATYIPIPCKAIWIPAGSTINGYFDSMAAGDQVDRVGLLIESVAV